MASLAANDAYTWVPPVPAGVQAETGYVATAANVGAFAPMYNQGWTCQTYLPFAGAGIVQTYSVKAPEEKSDEKPKTAKTTRARKAGK